jgi:hypothetical protein
MTSGRRREQKRGARLASSKRRMKFDVIYAIKLPVKSDLQADIIRQNADTRSSIVGRFRVAASARPESGRETTARGHSFAHALHFYS